MRGSNGFNCELALEQLFERVAIDVLKRHVETTIYRVAEIMDRDGIRVFKLRDDAHFAKETFLGAWRSQANSGTQDLECDVPVHGLLVGEIDHTEATAAEFAENLVFSLEDLSDLEGVVGFVRIHWDGSEDRGNSRVDRHVARNMLLPNLYRTYQGFAKMVSYLDARELPEAPKDAVSLHFEAGTLVIDGVPESVPLAHCVWDDRVGRWRTSAHRYRWILATLLRGGHTVWDAARAYSPIQVSEQTGRVSFDHQLEALNAWKGAQRCGVVVLPTGAGKSFVAIKAIEEAGRSALVVAPTLDLVEQWIRLLSEHFGETIGALGGGTYDPQDLTVSTYDSAAIHMERLGNRYGLIIFDEVHHLPSPTYRWAAEACIAPYRLGLSATPERPDGLHNLVDELVGPVICRKTNKELSGEFLADYTTEVLEVAMGDEDMDSYTEARARYQDFVSSQGIRMGGRQGWHNFLAAAARSEQGREAFRAFRASKQLAMAHSLKLERVAELLHRHQNDRTLVFTNDNLSVYAISEKLLCPALTHQTPLKERAEILRRFASGEYRVVVTSRVLNEGVDVPDANVAIVLSGTGSVREHVQRLGRILRRADSKQAILYELVTPDTVEAHVSRRRRTHDAYE